MFSTFDIPNQLPLIYITNDVLLPGSSIRIPITTPQNMNLAKLFLPQSTDTKSSHYIIGVLSCRKQEDAFKENIIGTAAVVFQVMSTSWPKSTLAIIVVGLQRFKTESLIAEEPYPIANVALVQEESVGKSEELTLLMDEFKKNTAHLMHSVDVFHPIFMKIKKIIQDLPESALVDAFASFVCSSFDEKFDILNTLDFAERLKKINPILVNFLEDKKSGKVPRGTPVIKIIRSRLPLGSNMLDMDDSDDLVELQEKLKKANLPPYAHKVAFKEFQRLKRMGPYSTENGVIRNYVELMAELPWSVSSNEIIDIKKAKMDLNADHYGMSKLKKRVLEYLAVRQLKNQLRGPILCFVGPPGVGKTSIGRSIAKTLGRKFHRISLGGVAHQSDIRGHRRTYVGALPGRIIQGLKTVGHNNPVMLLDEIDKLGTNTHGGDPEAALLEVLDPEQNCHFVDHYLNVPFDLSQITFIATANRLNKVSPALLDRMEVIHMSGYTQEEKLHIACRHLLPKQLQLHGLEDDIVTFPKESIKLLISGYTHEAGVRTLERQLAAICRSVAVTVAETKSKTGTIEQLPIVIDTKQLENILGAPVYDGTELWCRLGVIGVAVGLGWTPSGGLLLLVEANKISGGTGELILTGHLGSVMKESAKLALNWVRTVAYKYDLTCEGMDIMHETDVHIHFPAGAVGKDGPSAGIAIATALISLFTGIPVAPDVAITGEITLRGIVLPVGGIKEKVLAAHRVGLKRVIMPKKCKKYLVEIPNDVKKEMTFVLVTQMLDVLDAAFDGELTSTRQSTSIASKL